MFAAVPQCETDMSTPHIGGVRYACMYTMLSRRSLTLARTCSRISLHRTPMSSPVPQPCLEFVVINCRKAGMSCATASRSCARHMTAAMSAS